MYCRGAASERWQRYCLCEHVVNIYGKFDKKQFNTKTQSSSERAEAFAAPIMTKNLSSSSKNLWERTVREFVKLSNGTKISAGAQPQKDGRATVSADMLSTFTTNLTKTFEECQKVNKSALGAQARKYDAAFNQFN